jgi:hypothetical protein
MAQTTRARPVVTGYRRGSAGPPAGRFARQSAAGRRVPQRPARRRAQQRNARLVMAGVLQRRQPEPKGMSRVLKTLGRTLPGAGSAAKRRSSRPGGKASAGMALLVAAGGLAFKNRDRLSSLAGRRKGGDEMAHPPVPPGGETRPPL